MTEKLRILPSENYAGSFRVSLAPGEVTHLLLRRLGVQLQGEIQDDVWRAERLPLGASDLFSPEKLHQIPLGVQRRLFRCWLRCFLFHGICVFKRQFHLCTLKQRIDVSPGGNQRQFVQRGLCTRTHSGTHSAQRRLPTAWAPGGPGRALGSRVCLGSGPVSRTHYPTNRKCSRKTKISAI